MSRLNIVGSQLQALRRQREPTLTQQGLAVRLQLLGWDIDRFGVSKIERGQRQVTDKEVVLIAKALQVAVSDLFGYPYPNQ